MGPQTKDLDDSGLPPREIQKSLCMPIYTCIAIAILTSNQITLTFIFIGGLCDMRYNINESGRKREDLTNKDDRLSTDII